MPPSTYVPPAVLDLRKVRRDDVLARVERSLAVRLDAASEVRKRRSVGFRTDRGTWVRVEARPTEKIDGQGWNGTECAAAVSGVSKPAWYQAVSWADSDAGLMWRADEMELVAAAAIKRQGVLTEAPDLSEKWWATFGDSLDALAASATTRVATLHTEPVTQQRVTATVEKVFPGRVDTSVTEWAAAHGDLTWSNLTSPECFLLDWEDWGMAPRGLDSADIWASSLAVSTLADRVRRERAGDLDSRSGRLAMLFFCCDLTAAGPPVGYTDPLYEPALRAAETLVGELEG